MRMLSANRIAVAVVAGVVVLAWVRPSLNASPPQIHPPQPEMGGAPKEDIDLPRIYFRSPITPEAAKIWQKLGQKITLKFENETPLRDFLKAVREATTDKDTAEGVSIYIDPVGLMEAEKTLDSPITINLAGVRLATGLELALKQLELAYSVHPDGLLVITSSRSADAQLQDPTGLILDKLDALQKEVAKLRLEMGASKK